MNSELLLPTVRVIVLFVFLTGCRPGVNDGIPFERLKLAAHTVEGQFVEDDSPLKPDAAQWAGTAAVISNKDGKVYLVSNRHVLGLSDLADQDSMTDKHADVAEYGLLLTFATGVQKPVLRFALQQGYLDLALLEVDGGGLQEGRDYVTLEFSKARTLVEGQDVVAVGSPLGLSGTHTFGKISAIRVSSQGETCRYIQTDAAINFGNSGGPLFLKTGDSYKWIGVNTLKARGDNIGFAIDAEQVHQSSYRWYDANARGAQMAIDNVYPPSESN